MSYSPQNPLLQVLNPNQVWLLHRLGIDDLSEFAETARVAGPELSKFLGVDAPRIASNLPVPCQAIDDVVAFDEPFTLGVALDEIPVEESAFTYASLEIEIDPFLAAPAGNPLPNNVNLIPQMPQIRDQGRRGTCVAFSSLATLEHWRGLSEQSLIDFSEQLLYFFCKQKDGIPNQDGTWLGVAFPCLQKDGVCLESTWHYNPNPIPGNVGQGAPSARALIEAPSNRVPSFNQLSPTSVVDLKAELARGRCVSFSVPVFSWVANAAVVQTGKIGMPLPGESVRGGHAMTLVGYQDNAGDPGGGRFLLRNSWGSRWAAASAHAPGYGSIPYDYLARYGKEAYSLP